MRAWFDLLGEANVPCGPIYSMPQVFDDEQVRERAMRQELRRADGKAVSVTANPIRLSETPVGYALAPPLLGEHTDELLGELRPDGAGHRRAARRRHRLNQGAGCASHHATRRRMPASSDVSGFQPSSRSALEMSKRGTLW